MITYSPFFFLHHLVYINNYFLDLYKYRDYYICEFITIKIDLVTAFINKLTN